MNHDFTTNNKSFIRFYKDLETNGFYDPAKILELNDITLAKISPYSKNISKIQEAKVIRECCGNPWYVLREVLRTQVGASKRFLEVTPGEILALLNFLGGGRTFVSAPRCTVKTNLLVVSILMTLPKVVLYSDKIKGASFVSSIKRRYRDLISTAPLYLYDFYMNNIPTFIPLSRVDLQNGIEVLGFKNSEVIIIQDNYEFDDWSTPENLRKLEKARTLSKDPIRHLLVSSVNENIDNETNSYLQSIERIETVSIAVPELGIKPSTKMVPIDLKTIRRLGSDRAKSKYYKNIILKGYNKSLVDSMFTTR